ncbi:MAG: hypothetical protein ACLRWQ_13030 [Flavonifractor plautii]
MEVPGYEMLLVENVQVFPNTETLQELELIPLPGARPRRLPGGDRAGYSTPGSRK